MADNIILQEGNILLTTSKLQAGGNTYFLKNIGSISVAKGSNILIWFMYFMGAICIIDGFIGEGGWFFAAGIALIVAGRWLKNLFCTMFLDTNAGRVKVLKGRKNVLLNLKAKIEEAIEQAS